jgi:hypothetical protein
MPNGSSGRRMRLSVNVLKDVVVCGEKKNAEFRKIGKREKGN